MQRITPGEEQRAAKSAARAVSATFRELLASGFEAASFCSIVRAVHFQQGEERRFSAGPSLRTIAKPRTRTETPIKHFPFSRRAQDFFPMEKPARVTASRILDAAQ